MSLVWTSSILLFFLLFLNTLAVDAGQLRQSLSQKWPRTLLTLGLVFVFLPLLVAAAAKLWIQDQDFAFGLVVSSLAPCALVNPFFARIRGGNESLSLLHVLLTTLICPLVTVPILNLLGYTSVFLDMKYSLYFLGALTVMPLMLSLGVAKFFPKLPRTILPFLPLSNSLILALLMFILVGSSLTKVPLRFFGESDFLKMIIFFLVADFGFFILVRYSAGLFGERDHGETIALSASSRNFAVSASLMLFFHPKAAVPSAIGLMIHAFFFQWLLRKRNFPAVKPVFVLATISFFLFGRPASAAEILRICVPASYEQLGVTHLLAADHLGYFQRADMTVDVSVKTNLVAAVAGNQCDLSVFSPDEVFDSNPNLLGRTLPIVTLSFDVPTFTMILAPKQSPISEARELAGKNVRTTSRQDAMVVSPDGVNHVKNISIKDLPASFKSEAIKAAVISGPFASYLSATGNFRILRKSRSRQMPNPLRRGLVFLAVSRRYADAYPSALPVIRKIIGDVYTYLERNPSRHISAVKKYSKMLDAPEMPLDKKTAFLMGRQVTRFGFDSLVTQKPFAERAKRKNEMRDYFSALAITENKSAIEAIVDWSDSF